MRSILALFLFFYLAGWALAQHSGAPTLTAKDVEAGGNIFHSHCAECHGLNGEGGRGPDLTRGAFRHGASDVALFRTISLGVPGTQMPGSYFPDHQIWQVVAFVKSMSHPTGGNSIPGNAKAGEKIFQESGCEACHMIRGEGGRLGPDLTDIGSIRSPAYLRMAILDPNAKPSADYRAVQLVDKSGKQISGVLLNEDTYSVQIMDYQENLRSHLKRDLQDVLVSQKSAMPAFADKIRGGDLDNLTAFLCSLKKAH